MYIKWQGPNPSGNMYLYDDGSQPLHCDNDTVIWTKEQDALLMNAAPDMLKALLEIVDCRGAYSQDSLTQAENCIDAMKKLASDAIAKAKG